MRCRQTTGRQAQGRQMGGQASMRFMARAYVSLPAPCTMSSTSALRADTRFRSLELPKVAFLQRMYRESVSIKLRATAAETACIHWAR